MKMTRRKFLRRTVAGALLIGAGIVVARHVGGYKLDGALAEKLRVLSPKEAEIFVAFCRRMLVADGPDAPPLDEPGAVLFVDGYLQRVSPEIQDDIKGLLQLFEHGSGFFRLSTARFTRMSAAAQDAVLADWETSRLALRRQGFQGLKTLALFAYWRDARTWPVLGYDGPTIGLRR